MPCETSRDLSLLVDGVQGRGVRVDVLDRSLDDDLGDFGERHGVRELRGRSLQQLGALPQPLLLVVELAALERESALGHHRLELSALAVAQLARVAERDVERAVDPGRCLERHRHPAGVLERRSTCERVISSGVSAHTGSPLAIARANGTSASSPIALHASSASSE